MNSKQFSFQSQLSVPVQDAFAWHMRKGALQRLLPPWIQAAPLFPPGSPDEEGSQVGFAFSFGPLRIHWLLEHAYFVQDQEFTDIQIKGPFRSYSHCHPLFAGGSIELYTTR